MSGIIGGVGGRSGIVGETEIDYETGTHSTTLSGSSGSVTQSASYGKISYTKIGRLVHIMGTINPTDVSSASGRLLMTLPFIPKANDTGSGYMGTMVSTLDVDIAGDGETISFQLTDPGSVARGGYFAMVDAGEPVDQLATGYYRFTFSYEI